MKLVIDCNVFVSAALGSKSCRQVIEKAFLDCDVFYSDEILREIKSAFLKPKLSHAKAEGASLLEKFGSIGTRTENFYHLRCRSDTDPKRKLGHRYVYVHTFR